jgi:hypothetical protein
VYLEFICFNDKVQKNGGDSCDDDEVDDNHSGQPDDLAVSRCSWTFTAAGVSGKTCEMNKFNGSMLD